MLVRDFMTKDVVSVEIPGNRDDILKIMKRTGISGVPVLKNQEIIGIITRKDLLTKSEETQIGLLMTPDPVTISPDAELEEAARMMITHHIRRLPVVERKVLIGLLSTADLINAIAQLKIKTEIKEFNSRPAFALWEETPLSLVGRVMEISGLDAIPLLDDEGRLSGIISERDLIRHSSIEDSVETSDFSNGTDDDEWTWESIRDLHTLTYGVSRVKLPHRPVKTAMIKNVINVTVNTEVSECALKMRRARVDQVPIVNSERKLVSVLYDRDLIRALCPHSART
jgi:CBS domain-containing protein